MEKNAVAQLLDLLRESVFVVDRPFFRRTLSLSLCLGLGCSDKKVPPLQGHFSAPSLRALQKKRAGGTEIIEQFMREEFMNQKQPKKMGKNCAQSNMISTENIKG